MELILVDDASPDAGVTLATLRELREKYQTLFKIEIVMLSNNVGPGGARNAGWDRAAQPYIAFLDADDAWHPRKLECQHGWMASHPEISLSGHACPIRYSEDWPKIDKDDPRVRRLHATQFLVSNQFSTPTAMLRRDLPYRFQTGKYYAEDYLLWLQMVLDGVRSMYIDLPLAAIHKPAYGGAGLSGRLWAMERGVLETYWQLRREHRLGGVAASLLSGLSLAKYARRRLLVALRALRRG